MSSRIPPLTPPRRQSLWRAMPPVVFLPLLGLVALGLAWRRVLYSVQLPEAPAELILGAVSLLFLFALAVYAAKAIRRAGAVIEDLRSLPGRAGLASMTGGVMLLAAVAGPYSAALAAGFLWLGLALHAGQAVLALRALAQTGWRVDPVWHLSFAGLVLAAPGALALYLPVLALWLLGLSGAVALAIWGASLRQIRRERVPAPLRPLLAIHLVPACLFTMTAAGLGLGTLTLAFGALSAVIGLALLIEARWLTEAGYGPLWGAFTLPMAAAVSATVTLGWSGLGMPALVLSVVMLVAASSTIPLIAVRVLQAWARDDLARRTNASVA